MLTQPVTSSKICQIIAFACLLLLQAAYAHANNPHIVFELKTGKVFSQEKAFDRWYPASLTKMMTAYTVFREIKAKRITLYSPVRITANALSKPPSKMGFPVGTILNFDAALKIILVKSANDVSVAIAESAAGSEQAFAGLMNRYAREIGMRDSNFVNPHGLHDPQQYTSAHDLAILAKRIYTEFPKESALFSIPAIKVGNRILRNHNALIQRFPGSIGMKTGFVCAAGLNLVASAKIKGGIYIAVVLGGETGRKRNVKAAQLMKDASVQPFSFNYSKIDRLVRPLNVAAPVDMTETVCRKKRVQAVSASNEEDGEGDSVIEKEPDIKELEARYLLEKGSNTLVIPVSLGNATGPDPYQLNAPVVAAVPESTGSESASSTGFVKAEAFATQSSNALVKENLSSQFDSSAPSPAALATQYLGTSTSQARPLFKLADGQIVILPTARPLN